jgi:GNAT superfamily N-acetyltransferase
MQLIRTNSDNKDFIELVQELDKLNVIRNGEDQKFYAQYNKLDSIKQVVIIYENNIPVGCGAIKYFDENTMEVKRMFTRETARGKGVASKVLQELEKWTRELNFNYCILETGAKYVEAIGLYKKNGYQIIPNYGQYIGVETSVCFKKKI